MNLIGSLVVGIKRRIEVVDAAIFFRQSAVPVVPHPSCQTEIRQNLELVLNISASLVRAVVPVGIAQHERCCGEIVILKRNISLQETGKVGRGDHAFARPVIADVELRVSVAAAKGNGVLA